MTKNTLLTATAFAALAFAGAANAQVVTTAEVSSQTVRTTGAGPAFTVTNSPYGIANESNITAIQDRRTLVATGANDVTFSTTADRLLEYGTTYRVTYALSGSATPTFAAQVAAGSFTITGVAAGCIASAPTVVAGTGATGATSVSYIFTTTATAGAGCVADATVATSIAAAAIFNTDVPFQIASIGGVSANLSGALDPSNTNAGAQVNRFSTAGSTVELVRASAGYRLFVDSTIDGVTADGPDNADALTQLSLGTSGAPFRAFTAADRVIGAAGFVTAPTTGLVGVFAGLDATGLPAPAYNLAVSATAGDFTVLRPEIGVSDALGTDLTVATSNLTAATGTTTGTAITGARSIGIRIEGTPTASIATTPQSYTATVTPTAPLTSGGVVNVPGALTNAQLETIGLQGTTFVAPWVQSSNASYNTVLRLSNSGAVTGAVQLTISSPLVAATRTVCTATELPKLASIPAGGELAINSTDLTTCFGAFTRGDVSVTVLSLSTNLTAKLRIVSPGGVVAEQSLGRFGAPSTY